jgi:hypothetical protein
MDVDAAAVGFATAHRSVAEDYVVLQDSYPTEPVLKTQQST